MKGKIYTRIRKGNANKFTAIMFYKEENILKEGY